MKGLFITFEGPDGGGKSTQLKNIAKILREEGYDVVESREPGGTDFAEKVRALVLDASIPLTATSQSLLYFAARAEHVDKLLRPSKEAGKIVLCVYPILLLIYGCHNCSSVWRQQDIGVCG